MTKQTDIKVGYLCNNKCQHCAIGDMRRSLIEQGIPTELTTQQIFDLLVNAAKDSKQIVLTGGEITIRKDCDEIINKALSLFDSVQIQTNGRRIDRNLLDSITDLSRCSFAVALHSHKESVHDNITQVKHSYTQTVNGLRLLSEYKVHVCVKMVLSKLNFKDCLGVVTMTNQLGFNRVNIAYVHGCGDARVNIDNLLVPYEHIQPYVTDALVYSENNKMWTDLETFPLCKVDPQFYINSCDVYMNIDRTLCVPVNEDKFDWDASRKFDNKHKGEECQKCILRCVCEGPWKEYNLSPMKALYPDHEPIQGSHDVVVAKLKTLGYLMSVNHE